MSNPRWVWVKTERTTYGMVCRNGFVVAAPMTRAGLVGMAELDAATILRAEGAEVTPLTAEDLVDA